MEPILKDYALIGNCRSSALVSRFGSIDWCCLPEFDSPTIFAALLDRGKGGFFSITPTGDYESTQRYLPDTNVVETRFASSDGDVRLLDAFTAVDETEKALNAFPDHEILRFIEGLKGQMRMRMTYAPRNYYGQSAPRLVDDKKLGIRFSWKGNVYNLLTTLNINDINVTNDACDAFADFQLSANEHHVFSLTQSCQSPAIIPEVKVGGLVRIEKTIRFAIGFVHALFVLSVGLEILNSFHPRMARPFQGPTPTRQLEPPGFLALNYGKGTPIAKIVAHVVYGAILGLFL